MATGGAETKAAQPEALSPPTPPLSMEYFEPYLVTIKKRAYSTIFIPILAMFASLVLTGHVHVIWDWILLPTVTLLFRIVGIALGIGLGLGLATHVHDTLETWHERQLAAREQQATRGESNRSLTQHAHNASANSLLKSSNVLFDDETSYAALMTSAGYDVSNGIRRGQIIKSTMSINYPFTQLPPNEQNGPIIMKQTWPHLPLPITHEIGCWIEHVVRDYVAIWYCMIDASCPYQNERTKRQQESNDVNGNGSTDDNASNDMHRQMVLQTGPHRPLPLVTAMYHSLAIVLGNLASRVEHANVYSLVLLKFTRVLSNQLKTWRELKTMALAKMNSSVSTTNDGTTIMFDEFGKAMQQPPKRRAVVSEMTMVKEFLLADKLHKAVTFGMDIPSLLFADASGKECNDVVANDANNMSEEAVLEQRLFPIMQECEQDYNRVLGHRLCRALLPRSEFASPIIRTLMTELLGGCILTPIMSIFAPDYVNSWISTALQAVLTSKQTNDNQDSSQQQQQQQRSWDDDDSVTDRMNVELELDTVFQDDAQLMEHEEEDDVLNQSGFNEAIEVIRNPTNDDSMDEDNDTDSQVAPLNSDDEEHHHHQGHDSQTVSGDYILPLLTMAVIDLQRFVDLAREDSFHGEEDGTDWDQEQCQDAVRQVVLVIEAALIHGRRRQRLTKRELDKAGNDETSRRDHQGDTLLPFFSSNLSQVLMELTSDIDAFETRIAKEETRLKSDQNEEPKKKGDGPSMSCKPAMSELSTLRTLIAAWLHTGQVYKTLSLLIQARQSILVPYFHEDAFLRDNDNGKGFVSQLKALDGVEIMVDTTSILASSTLDMNADSSDARIPSPKKRNLTIQSTSPSGNSLNAHPSPRLTSSLTQSMARRSERLTRFMSGGSNEDAVEYGVSVGASMNAVTGSEGPTPRYLDFHRNQNFSSSLRTERERRKESWQHVCAAMPDQSLKIVHRVKGSTVADMEQHRDLHRLSRTFYAGTNKIGLKDGTSTRPKPIEADAANSNNDEEHTLGDDDEVLPVSLLTVEMIGAKRRIEIPDDDSSFLIRAQPRPLKSESVHIDQRNHGQTYRTFAATFEEAAVPSGSFRYSGGRYIRRCLLRYYPNDRTASIELPSLESTRMLDCRKARAGPPTSINIGPVPPKANPLSGDFLRKNHLCQKWIPRGAAPRAGSSLLASPTMEPADFHSVPRAGKSIDFVYRMSLFECPMVELSGKKFTVHDSSVLGAHRADASSIELSDASLSLALLTAGDDWERQLSEQDDQPQSHGEDVPKVQPEPGVEMGPDGYPIVWIKLHKKQGDVVTTDIQPYRASYMRAAMMLASTRQDAQRQCLVYCVRAGSARNATRARVDSILKPTQRLLEFATSPSREKQSILMRDLKLGINHVDREQLRRNKLLSPRFPTNIRSLSAIVEEAMTVKDTGVAFPGSSPSSTVFKIRCVAVVDLIDTEDDEIDWSDYDSSDASHSNSFREEWVVYRQFRDFNVIHKHLKSQVAVTETSGTASSRLVGAATAAFVGGGPSSSDRHRKVLIPSLVQANKAGALGLTQKAIEKRRAILHDYLQHLLAPNHPLRQCSEILIFLGAFYPFPDGIRVGDAPTVEPDALGRVGMVRAVYGDSIVAPSTQDVYAITDNASFSSPDKSVTREARSFSVADSVTTPTENQSQSRRRSSRSQEEDMPPAIRAKIDKVPLSKVRQAMFELIRAQFDFENASFFRNRLLTAIKTMSFAVASNAEFRKTLYNTHKSYLNPEALADLIKLGLDTVWPDGVFFESSPALTPKQSQELAQKAKELLVNAFPDQLRSILGSEITTDGLEMLHEMLQNRVVLKSLFYMFVDLLLLEVFPEFQDFLTGGAALETE